MRSGGDSLDVFLNSILAIGDGALGFWKALPQVCETARGQRCWVHQAHLWPSEIVTVGVLFGLKGTGEQAFYRWLVQDYRPLFPRLPKRSRLFRRLRTHRAWTYRFLVAPTRLEVMDTDGIELLHSRRDGRSRVQWA